MPSTEYRRQLKNGTRRLVVKVGTQLLTAADGSIDTAFMASIARQLAELMKRGIDVALVSSGAIGVGRIRLGLASRPKDVGTLQAVAAIGQTGLMNLWHDAFSKHDLRVGQILLTRNAFEDRSRYLNFRNCITQLHELNAVPIINENDTVSVEEISLGDNDVLAALVTNALPADTLIILSSIEGLYDAAGNVVELVKDVATVESLIQKSQSAMGTGGMKTKLMAAKLATEAGETMVIASGRRPDVLLQIMEGANVGTLFAPSRGKLPSRRRWIGMTVRPAGTITVDEGAAKAITQRGTSLLATGITAVSGRFSQGDVVSIAIAGGGQVARGLTNYSTDEVTLLMGKRSTQFEKILGRQAHAEIIHRDNLVVTAPGAAGDTGVAGASGGSGK